MPKLQGDELLQLVKDNADAAKEVLLEKAGYYTTKPDGSKSYKMSEFYTALISAQGLDLAHAAKPSGGGGTGRQLGYETTCQKNGSVLLGRGYTSKHGYEPGSSFEVAIKPGAIKLTPIKK